MKTIFYLVALSLGLCLGTGCRSHSRTQRGAAVGAATGAIVGGVIGNQSGNPRTGAAVGAAVGGLAGGSYANRQDRAVSSNESADHYLYLMTPEEIDILRARAQASGNSRYALTDYLTEQERINLRRRNSTEGREIGR